MERVNLILNSSWYQEHLNKINQAEATRIFCRHGLDHALNVARIAYIYLLEQGENLPREIVYTAALLHDIGRPVEYETGEDHALASAELAREWLRENNFSETEVDLIVRAISEHRQKPTDTNLSVLGQALALADDWARDCRSCLSQNECYKFTPQMLWLEF